QPPDDRPPAVPSSPAPVTTDTTTASARVAGANRVAKARPNVPACIANSFRSTIGPTTRKVSRAVGETPRSEAATTASPSEQIDSTTAKAASVSTPNSGL